MNETTTNPFLYSVFAKADGEKITYENIDAAAKAFHEAKANDRPCVIRTGEYGSSIVASTIQLGDKIEKSVKDSAFRKAFDRYQELSAELPEESQSAEQAIDGVKVAVSGRHIGPVVEIKRGYAIQSIGRGDLIAHDLSKLEINPNLGDTLNIQYREGKPELLKSKCKERDSSPSFDM